MPRGGKHPGAGRPPRHQSTVSVRLDDAHRRMLDRLHAALGGSQGDVVARGLEALERERLT